MRAAGPSPASGAATTPWCGLWTPGYGIVWSERRRSPDGVGTAAAARARARIVWSMLAVRARVLKLELLHCALDKEMQDDAGLQVVRLLARDELVDGQVA